MSGLFLSNHCSNFKNYLQDSLVWHIIVMFHISDFSQSYGPWIVFFLNPNLSICSHYNNFHSCFSIFSNTLQVSLVLSLVVHVVIVFYSSKVFIPQFSVQLLDMLEKYVCSYYKSLLWKWFAYLIICWILSLSCLSWTSKFMS